MPARHSRSCLDPSVTAKGPSVTDFQRPDLMLGPKNRISLFASVVPPLISRLMLAPGFQRKKENNQQGNELFLERPVQKEAADQRRQRRPMPCCRCRAAAARCRAPCKRAGPCPADEARRRSRSALHRRRPRSSRRRIPARQPACSGGPLLPLSFVLSSLTSLFMQQAEQGSKTLRFSMQCLLLEREQVEQEFVFLNTGFLSFK